jgi:hypothetical protein
VRVRAGARGAARCSGAGLPGEGAQELDDVDKTICKGGSLRAVSDGDAAQLSTYNVRAPHGASTSSEIQRSVEDMSRLRQVANSWGKVLSDSLFSGSWGHACDDGAGELLEVGLDAEALHPAEEFELRESVVAVVVDPRERVLRAGP